MIPVFIPSKGRATLATTPSMCSYATLFVEPQDADAYRKAWPKHLIHVLPQNDSGIGFVRQFMLEEARLLGHKWYWQVDDDMESFQIGKKVAMLHAFALAECCLGRIHPGTAIVGFRWKHTPATKRSLHYNVGVYRAILTRTDTGINYRTKGMRQDTDFIFQHFAAGWKTMRVSNVCLNAPDMGRNAGGLHDAYAAKRHLEADRWLASMWPMCMRMDGDKIKIDWELFR